MKGFNLRRIKWKFMEWLAKPHWEAFRDCADATHHIQVNHRDRIVELEDRVRELEEQINKLEKKLENRGG